MLSYMNNINIKMSRGAVMELYKNRIVVKVGTSTLTNENGKSDLRSFDRLACVLSDIQNKGYEVILVSSGAKLIERIERIDDSLYSLAGGAGSRRGTGGMKTKIQAASLAVANGSDVIITNGKNPDSLYDIISGKPVGTLFKGEK